MECLNNLINHPISIHAPREGCDRKAFKSISKAKHFNPRTPRGVRHMLRGGGTGPHGFQSTHPARGATGGRCTDAIPSVYFNPRTPRGVRPHIPCSPIPSRGFQSTHPARGATSSPCRFRTAHKISIHAPREGCDLGARGRAYAQAISIHAPREGCDSQSSGASAPLSQFQSTHPARGATAAARNFNKYRSISIHAPREGCDSKLYQRAESLLGSICLFAQGEEG